MLIAEILVCKETDGWIWLAPTLLIIFNNKCSLFLKFPLQEYKTIIYHYN